MRWRRSAFAVAWVLSALVVPELASAGGDGGIGPPRGVTPSTRQMAKLRSAVGRMAPCTASLGDRVWEDRNGNGIQDPGEPGIGGMKVGLLRLDWTLVADATTDGTGRYLLSGICTGEYLVVPGILLPTDPEQFLEPAPCRAGTDPELDSNCPNEPIAISEDGSQDLTLDYGFMYRPCTAGIGDFVWNDRNGDGLQDPDEPGLAKAVVVLVDAEDVLMDWTQTDVLGHYCFPVTSGTWRIHANSTLPDSVASPCEVGTDQAVDSNCDPAWVTMPGEGGRDLGIDFGFHSEPQGGEGCSPGFWKQPQHFSWWPQPVSPADGFEAYFEDAFPGKALLDVLWQGGGGLNALGRHAVAALLNAASRDVSYDLNSGDVTSKFNSVHPGSKQDYENLKNEFARYNEQVCPIGEPVSE